MHERSYSLNKQALLDHVRNELHEMEMGLRDEISPTHHLAEQFGYSPKTVRTYFLEEGLHHEIRQKGEEREIARLTERLVPSRDFAWMVGAIASGGKAINHQTSLFSDNVPLIEKFKQTGERIFGLNCRISEQRKTAKNQPYLIADFFSTALVNLLGDLRREAWPETVLNQYRWIIDNQEYRNDFLSASFETRGYVDAEGKRKRIGFRSNYKNVADFWASLLIRSGIKPGSINVRRETNTREGIRGIEISQVSELKKIASFINTVQEEKAEKFAQILIEDIRISEHPESREEILQEWRQLSQELGHAPNSSEIDRLKKEGKTRFSPAVYITHFGGGKKEGTFRRAVHVIEILSSLDKPIPAEQVIFQASQEIPKRLRSPRTLVQSTDNLIKEWQRLHELTGGCVNSRSINRLKEEGNTKFSYEIYARRFGGPHRRFREAARQLNELMGQIDDRVETDTTEPKSI